MAEVVCLEYTGLPDLYAEFTSQPFYEDFPSTIERLRLCLVNPDILTPSERTKFTRVIKQGEQLCIRIFVRHAIRHGTYDLYSLGPDASPDFPRPGKTDGDSQPKRKFPNSQHVAAMDALRNQLNGTSISDKEGETDKKRNNAEHGSDPGHPRHRRNGLGVQSGRPPHAIGGYNVPSGYVPNAPHTGRIPSRTPMTWSQYDSGSMSGYHQPYGPYTGSYGMYGPHIAAPMQMDMPQYQQQVFPHMQNHNGGDPSSYQWTYGAWTGYQMPYQLPQANSFPSATGTNYAAQPLQAPALNQQAWHPRLPRQVYGATAPGQEQDAVHGLGAPAHVSHPNMHMRDFTQGTASQSIQKWRLLTHSRTCTENVIISREAISQATGFGEPDQRKDKTPCRTWWQLHIGNALRWQMYV